MSDSRRQPEPLSHALQALNSCVNDGACELLKEQKEFLAKFWDVSEVTIEGSSELNDGMKFNLYQLLQNASSDSFGSVASKGISGEGYEGHYFWDTEIYIFPFLLFTQPKLARNLLDFRYNTLEGAFEHARIMGHSKGALYPWRTISGSECSTYFPAGSAQYHLTGDIAYAFLQYYYATGDIEYMASHGVRVLIETARLWINAGNHGRDGAFHIHAVTGPDEYTCLVSDNYYTNRSAQYNLRGAVKIFNMLIEKGYEPDVPADFDLKELKEFTRAADAMCLPYDKELRIHAQDSTFLQKPVWNLKATPAEKFPLLLHYHPLYLYRHQVCKQADTVLAYFLFEDGIRDDDIMRGYEYYEKITTHDSSLSGCIFGIMASRLGFDVKAYDYFKDTARTDLDNTHGNTKDGLHMANLGGTWMSLVCGFAGMRLKGDKLHFRFTLPMQWEGYSFKIRYKGSLLSITVAASDSQVYHNISLVEGTEVTVYVDGKARRIV
jgi:alpha,alpha-trehalose phosphorylase